MTDSKRYLLTALVWMVLMHASTAFHMHKIMTAALLANTLNRAPILPLPIPIPIPVKAGGNTIIAVGEGDDDHYNVVPTRHVCPRKPCSSGYGHRPGLGLGHGPGLGHGLGPGLGHRPGHGRRIDFGQGRRIDFGQGRHIGFGFGQGRSVNFW